jgi:hypothetical protein
MDKATPKQQYAAFLPYAAAAAADDDENSSSPPRTRQENFR